MVEVKKITKVFDDTIALDQVSFSINKGEVTGFLGPNGAGKTTAMRIMTGYLESDEGEVLYEGKAISSNFQDLASNIGYLPESNPLYTNMRVDEFLLYNARLHNVQNIDSVRKIVKETGLTEKVSSYISDLSKGYKQRVGLAKALIGDVQYLILDEPTTGLDPIQKEEIISLIKKISKNKTILFSSHILSEISEIADKVIIINKGKIVASGSGKDLVNEHFKSAIIKLKTNAPFQTLKTAFQSIKNISQIKSENQKSKFYEVFVTCSDSENVSRQIFQTIAKNKWELIELYTEKQGIESLFKELTK